MNRIFFAALSLISIMSLSSCNTSKAGASASQHIKNHTLGQTENAIEKVLYGDWYITHAGALDIATSGEAMPTVSFGESPEHNPYLVSFSAYDGCNFNNGMYAVAADGNIKLAGHPMATMRFCGDSPYETAVVTGLVSAASYSLDKQGDQYTLTLRNAAGETTLTMQKYDIDFINGNWTATLINGVSVPQAAEVALTIDLAKKSITGNAGCNNVNGKVTTDSRNASSILFKDMITTRMSCPYLETEQSLLNALSTVTSLRPGPTSATALLLNAQGNTVIELTRL